MDLDFLTKSLPLQLAIGGGYLAYITAYVGIRAHHTQTDIAFLTIAFGLVATATAFFMGPLNWPNVAVIPLCLIASVIAGLFWRKYLRWGVRKALRWMRVSFADDDPSVFAVLASDTRNQVTQVTVSLDDGRELLCDSTGKFRDAPLEPFIFGSDGSVAMYVTHVYALDANGVEGEKVNEGVRDPNFGDNMTFIPAGSIKHLDVRLRPRPSGVSSSVAARSPSRSAHLDLHSHPRLQD